MVHRCCASGHKTSTFIKRGSVPLQVIPEAAGKFSECLRKSSLTRRRELDYSHLTILRSASAFSRRPPRTNHVGGFAVDAIGGIHYEPAVNALIYACRAHVHVKLGDVRRHVLRRDEVRRNVVARCVSRFEIRVELAEGQLAVWNEGRTMDDAAHVVGI